MTPGKLGDSGSGSMLNYQSHRMDESLGIYRSLWKPHKGITCSLTGGGCLCFSVCLYCLSVRLAYQLNLGKRWKEGWPNRHLLIATHKSSIPDLSTWLVCQIPVPTGKLRPRSDIDVSYLALSSHVDSGSNISLLADPSALPFGPCGVQFKWSCLLCRSRILLVYIHKL